MIKYRSLYFLLLLLSCIPLLARELDKKCIDKWPIYTWTANSKTITLVPSNHAEIFNLCPGLLMYLANLSQGQRGIAIEADIVASQKKSISILHDGTGWSDEFSSKSIDSAEKLLNHLGANSATLKYIKSLKPIYGQFALGQFALVGVIEANGPSIDLRAIEMAQLNNVLVNYLETLEDQLNAMEKVSLVKINQGVEHLHDFFACYECREEYYSAWKNVVEKFSIGSLQNAENSWNLLMNGKYPLTPVDRELVDARNESLVKKMLVDSTNGVALFYIGAGHFWGEKSIISILRRNVDMVNSGTLRCMIVSQDGVETTDVCLLH